MVKKWKIQNGRHKNVFDYTLVLNVQLPWTRCLYGKLFRSTNSIRYMLNSIRPSLWLQIENSKWPPSLVRSLSYYVVLWGNVFLRNWLINECVQCIFGWKNELLSHTRVCHMLFKHSEIAFLRNSLVCPMHVMIEEITTRVCPMLYVMNEEITTRVCPMMY